MHGINWNYLAFPSEYVARSPELLGVIPEQPQTKGQIDLSCCLGSVYLFFPINFSMKRRKKKTQLIGTVRASGAILVIKIIEFVSSVQNFVFFISLTIHASNKPTISSSCQMGDSL